MASYKGIPSPYAELPSKDKGKGASVNFSVGNTSTKGASWKGMPCPDGAKPSERKARISPSSINDVRAARKSSMGSSPKG